MKIIQIVPSIADEASGPSYSVSRLCHELLNLGCEVTLAALDWAPMKNQPEFLKVFPLGIGPRRLGRSPMMFTWLGEQCDKGEVAILHNHGMWYISAIYPSWMAGNRGIPLMLSPRDALSSWSLSSGSKLKPFFWRLFQYTAIQKVSCFHATCEAEYKDIRALGFSQPVAIIPNGVDLPHYYAKTPSNRRLLTFLGRLHQQKALENLLTAWKSVQNEFKNWHLRLIGPGEANYIAHLKSFAVELKLQHVEFTGPMYGEEKWRAYADSNLFVLPSHSENFAMSVAEALAAGTPAIVSKGAPWAGLVDEGAGWWIDIGAVPLAGALREAMSRDTAELSIMGLRGRTWMERDFSWDQIGRQMTDVYHWLLNRRSPPPTCVRLD